MEWRQRIVCDPEILGGKPTVKGTRISVELVIDSLAAGIPEAEILAAYPTLQPDSVRVCLAYISDLLEREKKVALAVA